MKGNGFITREELFLLLRNTLTKFPSDEDTEEALRELVEISMKLMVRELVYVEPPTGWYNFGSGPFKIVPTCEILS